MEVIFFESLDGAGGLGNFFLAVVALERVSGGPLLFRQRRRGRVGDAAPIVFSVCVS